MAYDQDNIFAKILRGEIPVEKIYEDGYAIAFPDIDPQAPTHVLIIPTGPYESLDDFAKNATVAEIAGFWRAVGAIGRQLGVDETGYRTLANTGPDAHQEVMHFHVHLFAGKKLGPMLTR